MAQAPALPTGFELPLEPRLPRIGSIDQVAIEERAGTPTLVKDVGEFIASLKAPLRVRL